MTTRTQRILERDDYRCQYCGGRAVHADHVVPKALRRGRPEFDDDAWIIAACFSCNVRRGTRRYVAPSWADRIAELPRDGWQVWSGGAHLEVVR